MILDPPHRGARLYLVGSASISGHDGRHDSALDTLGETKMADNIDRPEDHIDLLAI